jgi:hypothetical protein
METQIVIVNGKTRRAKQKFGSEHITYFVDIPLKEAEYFTKKCDVLGKTKSAILRDLVYEFNHTFGLPAEDRVKDPGSLFERRAATHIKEAVKEQVKKEFPWIFSTN